MNFQGGIGPLSPLLGLHMNKILLYGHGCSIIVFKLDENAIRYLPLNTEH